MLVAETGGDELLLSWKANRKLGVGKQRLTHNNTRGEEIPSTISTDIKHGTTPSIPRTVQSAWMINPEKSRKHCLPQFLTKSRRYDSSSESRKPNHLSQWPRRSSHNHWAWNWCWKIVNVDDYSIMMYVSVAAFYRVSWKTAAARMSCYPAGRWSFDEDSL